MKTKNIPNLLSIFRLLLTIVIIILLFLAHPDNLKHIYFNSASNKKMALFLISGALFSIGAFSDFLDGYIARKYNLVSNIGKFLDPLTDKVLVNITALALCVMYQDMFPWYILVIFLFRDYAIDGLRLILAKNKYVLPANIFGKIKTISQMFAMILIFFALPFFNNNDAIFFIFQIPLYFAALASLISGIIYIYKSYGQAFKN